MGKAGNKARKTRRATMAEIEANEYKAAKNRAKEQMKIEEEYGIPTGREIVPWKELEDAPIPKKEKEVQKKEDDKRRTVLIKDSNIEYPNLAFQIYLSCSQFDAPGFAEMFTRAGCMRARSLEEADVCLFGGGADVDPNYYGVTSKHPSTRSVTELDEDDMELYLRCFYLGIPMIGICRGAQFLHVMNGGKLYQDVDNHGKAHPIVDKRSGLVIQRASSVHHQMCYPNKGMEVLAVATESRNRWMPDNTRDISGRIDDIEAFFYRDTACIGFQGHPEYKGYAFYTNWCLQQIEDHLSDNIDLSYRQEGESYGYLRLSQDWLNQRDSKIVEETK